MKQSIAATIALVLMCWLHADLAAATETKVAVCKDCSDFDFRRSAELQAVNYPPFLEQGIQDVFVVDYRTEDIRYFEVERYLDGSCDSTGSGSEGDLVEPWMEVWITMSTEKTAPSAELTEIRGVLATAKDYAAEIQEFEAGDLDFGLYPIDSATDLVGQDGVPPNPHDVSQYRQAFVNELSDAMADSMWERVYWSAQSLASAAWNKFLGEVAKAVNVTTVFGDGTEITVSVKNIVVDESGQITGFTLEIVDGSAGGPGADPLPDSGANFVDLFATPFTGSPQYLENLSDLFVRGGGRTERLGGGSCTGEFECFYRQNDDGDWEPWCRLTVPKDELSC